MQGSLEDGSGIGDRGTEKTGNGAEAVPGMILEVMAARIERRVAPAVLGIGYSLVCLLKTQSTGSNLGFRLVVQGTISSTVPRGASCRIRMFKGW